MIERKDEHATVRPVIDAMLRRLRYLEVDAEPWGKETRSILWQIYRAAQEVGDE